MGCGSSIQEQESDRIVHISEIRRSIEIQKYRLKKKYGRLRECSIILQNQKCSSSFETEHTVPKLDIKANSLFNSRRTSGERKSE